MHLNHHDQVNKKGHKDDTSSKYWKSEATVFQIM